ncbi:MAG: hypothetical protein JKY40_07850 [Gammaproteobacteria bacterium]|nr:hypothetical protein [Gammaproteobacteria bacterium]
MSSPNGRKFWESIGQVEFNTEFTVYVNQLLENEPIDETSRFISLFDDS